MGTQFEWMEDYNIGVEHIDKEHQRLFKIINKIFELRDDNKDNRRVFGEAVKYLKAHAAKHFDDEEAYMESIGYDGLARHHEIHKVFRDVTLPTLETELEKNDFNDVSVSHFLGVCAGWLIGHTKTEDLAMTGRSLRRWDNRLSGEDSTSLKDAIVRLIFDMFHLESNLISDSYGGEKFGDGVYYRLVYGGADAEERQEVMLAFEERLLIETVGKAMGIQTNKLDNMLMHAVRFSAKQFAQRINEVIPSGVSLELKQENLLTYGQFKEIFEKEQLQAGLLFDTGAGYFAYCVIAPHLLEQGVATPIEADNAMDEVKRYLSERKREESEGGRKKILIVDDSSTIRQGIVNLLGGEYEVSSAASGAAAIRTITLNRPDLVLLDYEMPIVDGAQTLEMLRSLETFADIPVIFLTGRRDPETMIKVMPLKPEGYLLKNAKPEELKKEIDVFFARRSK